MLNLEKPKTLTMEKYDKRLDAYIEQAADFAQPILKHLRSLVHQASPEIMETMKWSFPHFDYKGTVCSFAAFKQHCAFGFWKSSLLSDPENLLQENKQEAMGQLGRITTLADLPQDEVLITYIQQAVALNEQGIKVEKKKPAPKAELLVPDFVREALETQPAAAAYFEKLSPSHKREYLEWITSAKTEETRNKRMTTTLEWLTEGRSRNWKYER